MQQGKDLSWGYKYIYMMIKDSIFKLEVEYSKPGPIKVLAQDPPLSITQNLFKLKIYTLFKGH